MTPRFSVQTTPRFARLARGLTDQHPQEFPPRYAEALVILETDPYNTSRQRPIKKLEAVRLGDGQYRLRLGRFRFRYDITGNAVLLISCGLRREDTYDWKEQRRWRWEAFAPDSLITRDGVARVIETMRAFDAVPPALKMEPESVYDNKFILKALGR